MIYIQRVNLKKKIEKSVKEYAQILRLGVESFNKTQKNTNHSKKDW